MIDEGRGLADVVGAGLEGQAPEGDGLALRHRRRSARGSCGQDALLGLVHLVDRLHHPRRGVPVARWAMWMMARMSLGKQEPP